MFAATWDRRIPDGLFLELDRHAGLVARGSSEWFRLLGAIWVVLVSDTIVKQFCNECTAVAIAGGGTRCLLSQPRSDEVGMSPR